MPRTKTKIAEMLSCRFKFKSADVVELVIIDHDNAEMFSINWNFRRQLKPKVDVEPAPLEEDEINDQ